MSFTATFGVKIAFVNLYRKIVHSRPFSSRPKIAMKELLRIILAWEGMKEHIMIWIFSQMNIYFFLEYLGA